MELPAMIAGLITLVVGAELLVRGASTLGVRMGVSSLVIGLTVVAFGTSAPELAVSVRSALNGIADIAVGNVMGSNIFNVLFILGLSALIIPLIVDQKLVRYDVPVMIGTSLLTWWFAANGTIERIEGGILFAGAISYTIWCVVVGRRESAQVQQEYEEAFGDPAVQNSVKGDASWRSGLVWQLSLIAIGLVLLVLGADWLVDGATVLARRMKISELVIGLTIVAGGTSLPELATSLVAAFRGERDIAVGNIVGSNIFNLLVVLGLTSVVSPGGIPVAEQALQFDIPVMVLVAGACLPVFFTGHLIARWEGALFVGYGVAYMAMLVMMAGNSPSLPAFQALLYGFAVPLTAVTLGILFVRAFRSR
ncbi:MAG: calcium/sodium antiporter [Planctomycetaceae bacterium]